MRLDLERALRDKLIGMDEGLTIAEAAERTGLTAHTLRYYERAGLLRPPDRGGNGHRRYRDHDLSWIRMLTRLRATGMPIAEIRRYFELVRAGAATEPERRRMLLEHRARVQAQVAQLQEDLALIDYKISSYAECFGSIDRSVAEESVQEMEKRYAS